MGRESQPEARLAANFTGIGGNIIQPPAFWDQQSLEKWAAVQQLIILITQEHYEALFLSLPSDTLQVLHPGITRQRGRPKTTGPPVIPQQYIFGGDFVPQGAVHAQPVLPVLWAHPCVANERFPPTCWEQRFGPVLNPETAHADYISQDVPAMPSKGNKLFRSGVGQLPGAGQIGYPPHRFPTYNLAGAAAYNESVCRRSSLIRLDQLNIGLFFVPIIQHERDGTWTGVLACPVIDLGQYHQLLGYRAWLSYRRCLCALDEDLTSTAECQQAPRHGRPSGADTEYQGGTSSCCCQGVNAIPLAGLGLVPAIPR